MPKQKAKNNPFLIKYLPLQAKRWKAREINFDAALHKGEICE
jgi:hypothetical protein